MSELEEHMHPTRSACSYVFKKKKAMQRFDPKGGVAVYREEVAPSRQRSPPISTACGAKHHVWGRAGWYFQ